VNQTQLFNDTEDINALGGLRVSVLVPLPFAGVLDYRLPDGFDLPALGSIVKVSVSGRKLAGVVWRQDESANGKIVPIEKLKPIEGFTDLLPVSDDLMQFIEWVAHYTLSPPGAVLRMCLSVPQALEPAPTRTLFVAGTIPDNLRITPARKIALDTAGDGTARSAADLARKADVSVAVISGLIKAGALVGTQVSVDRAFSAPRAQMAGPLLSDEQALAADAIKKQIQKGGFKPFLLDGITGSGKTEVYFEGLAEALKAPGAQVLVLVPEIALTSQWLDRFEDRFGVEPVVWHSDIGMAARRRGWRAIANGEARVVVGARSALFLPFQKLEFITVDEEHDPSFKQEEGVLYHARDMAIVRAKLADCPIVLASATPSVETLVNARSGRYQKLVLRERHGTAVLPDIGAIDMRQFPPESGGWLSPELVSLMQKTLDAGEQSMLFLNRRGYAPLTLCRTCGHRFECPNCSTWLVDHRFKQELQCHQCGFVTPTPSHCTECKTEDSLVSCGPGVERIFEEVSQLFSQARITVMTSDTMTRPREVASMVQQIASGHIDIVIGTQIVTKGYHFPNLTLVGVVDADLGLRGGDLRAGERTYQQMVQVAGRAGRAEKPGRVLLQTYEPEHPVMQALLSGDGEAFLNAEMESRARYNMPPFGRLVALIVSGLDLNDVVGQARNLASQGALYDNITVMGPAPAPLARVRGQYRYRLLMHAPKELRVQALMQDWVLRTTKVKGVRIKVDIDPYSFM
jgi:primosomal protein N' (replication factor Y)